MNTSITEKKCPNCGYYYHSGEIDEREIYSSPIITCKRCGILFWDPNRKEAALHGFSNKQKYQKVIKKIPQLILATLFMFACLFYIRRNNDNAILQIIYGILLLIGLYRLIQIFVKEPDNSPSRQLLYDESLSRLKDTEYLATLAKYDIRAKKLLNERKAGLPEHYAKRPGGEPLMRDDNNDDQKPSLDDNQEQIPEGTRITREAKKTIVPPIVEEDTQSVGNHSCMTSKDYSSYCRIEESQSPVKPQETINEARKLDKSHPNFCTRCGSPLNSDDDFCGHCGARVR